MVDKQRLNQLTRRPIAQNRVKILATAVCGLGCDAGRETVTVTLRDDEYSYTVELDWTTLEELVDMTRKLRASSERWQREGKGGVETPFEPHEQPESGNGDENDRVDPYEPGLTALDQLAAAEPATTRLPPLPPLLPDNEVGYEDGFGPLTGDDE